MTTAVPTASRTRSRHSWRVVDIVVASGVVFWAWGIFWNVGSIPLAFLPGLSALLAGGWLFAGVLGGLVVRKPGAALYTEVIAALVSMVIGTQWAWLTLLSGVVQGLAIEIVFALFAYRAWRMWTAVLAGMGGAVGLAVTDLTVWYPATDAMFKTVYALSALVSGALLAGLLSWFAVRGLARSGALARFAAGREVSA